MKIHVCNTSNKYEEQVVKVGFVSSAAWSTMSDNLLLFVPTVAFLAGFLAVVCLVHFVDTARCTSPVRLPPGPRGLPIIGNALQLPFDYQERTYVSWAKEFGKLYQFKLRRSADTIPQVTLSMSDCSGPPSLSLTPSKLREI